MVPHISESAHLRTRPRSLGSLALHGWDSSEDTSPPRRGAALPILASGVGQVGPVRQRAGGCEVGFDFSRDCVPGQPLARRAQSGRGLSRACRCGEPPRGGARPANDSSPRRLDTYVARRVSLRLPHPQARY